MTTLDEVLLQKLARWRPDSQRQPLELTHDSGWGVRLTADAVDEIGVRLWELSLTPTQPRSGPLSLTERAGTLANRVNGLLEPLRVIEVDEKALLRSATPAQRGGDRLYYEIMLQDDGSVRLHRYRWSSELPKREQIAFTLTHDSLAKFVQDVISCL
jgi:hypothetical protein